MAAGSCARRSKSERNRPATDRMPSSRSRAVSLALKRIFAPTCCIALPTSGVSSITANGPTRRPDSSTIGTVPAWLARGPPVIAA